VSSTTDTTEETLVIKKQWFAALAVSAVAVSTVALVLFNGGAVAGQTAAPQQVEYGPEGQPVAFPHNVHAGSEEGQFQIECMYCHFSAERSNAAGIPPVASCMGCHSIVRGDGSEEIAKVVGFWERREPIPWNRIYKVADHVQFPHLRHIAAGVECATCHGPVEQMGVIQQVQQPLYMGWCLTCHLEMGASRDCTVCHY
jgi:hypothetical protein